MRMLSRHSRCKPALSHGALWLLVAAFSAGCASKNPLMEEPAIAAQEKVPAATATVTSAAPTASAPESTAAATTTAAPPAPSTGVQTVKERRLFGFLSPYRPDIQQGNFVSQEMISQLKEGMTPDQVRFLLGTPLLNDIFHAERWDYPFRMLKGSGEITSSRVTVFFKDNRVARIEGGNLPTEEAYLARIVGNAPAKPKTPAAPAPQAAPSSANEPQ